MTGFDFSIGMLIDDVVLGAAVLSVADFAEGLTVSGVADVGADEVGADEVAAVGIAGGTWAWPTARQSISRTRLKTNFMYFPRENFDQTLMGIAGEGGAITDATLIRHCSGPDSSKKSHPGPGTSI